MTVSHELRLDMDNDEVHSCDALRDRCQSWRVRDDVDVAAADRFGGAVGAELHGGTRPVVLDVTTFR